MEDIFSSRTVFKTSVEAPDPVPPDPGWKKSRFRKPGLFLRTEYQFFGLKIVKILQIFDADPGSCQTPDPESG